MDNATSIASRISDRMEALGLSYAKVAGECGVSEQTVRNWCINADKMWACRVPMLARVLQCSVPWLLGLSKGLGKPPA